MHISKYITTKYYVVKLHNNVYTIQYQKMFVLICVLKRIRRFMKKKHRNIYNNNNNNNIYLKSNIQCT